MYVHQSESITVGERKIYNKYTINNNKISLPSDCKYVDMRLGRLGLRSAIAFNTMHVFNEKMM